jgi:hypothetical protein
VQRSCENHRRAVRLRCWQRPVVVVVVVAAAAVIVVSAVLVAGSSAALLHRWRLVYLLCAVAQGRVRVPKRVASLPPPRQVLRVLRLLQTVLRVLRLLQTAVAALVVGRNRVLWRRRLGRPHGTAQVEGLHWLAVTHRRLATIARHWQGVRRKWGQWRRGRQ